jgi:uncharacterized protein YdaU (DUF1376 family)
MAKIPYIPLYIGDWEQDTNCLSLQAEAAWLKIIFKMFKNDKNGTYKTSTKSLQNLWKTDTNGVQNILDELSENEICGIEIGEHIIFTNRRMVREAEISEKRTKAVQTRYKTPTKPLQNTEYDIDNESENDITNIEIKQAIEFLKITENRNFTDEQILSYWKAYLIHSKGEHYNTRAKQLQHFRNWLKKQPNETNKRTNAGDPARPGKEFIPC